MSNRMEPNGKPDYEKMALIGRLNQEMQENLKLRQMVIELQEKVNAKEAKDVDPAGNDKSGVEQDSKV